MLGHVLEAIGADASVEGESGKDVQGTKRNLTARATPFDVICRRARRCLSAARTLRVRRSDEWPRERFFRRGGNAAVIRQELESEHGVVVMRREAYVGVLIAG